MSAFGFPPPNDPGLSPPVQYIGINALSPTYGAKGDGVTDDSDSVQAAINAAAAVSTNHNGAPIDVLLQSGYGFKLSQITPKSGARLRCYGATIIPGVLGASGLVVWPNNNGILSNSGILGGLWAGAGVENANQMLFYTGVSGGLRDCRFQDMQITNWGVGPLYLRNPTRVKALTNTLINVGPSVTNTNFFNSINFVFDATATAGGEVIAAYNIIDGSGADSIAAVITSASVTGAMRVAFIGNIVSGMPSGGNVGNSGAIAAEFDAAATASGFLAAYNEILGYGTNGALMFGNGGAGGTVQRALAAVNRITNPNGSGILTSGTNPDVQAVDNNINAVTPLNGTFSLKSGNHYSTGAVQGRATLVGGTVTVNTAEIQTSDNVILTVVVPGGTRGEIQLGTIVNGTSFVINSIQPGTASTIQTLDTSTVYWRIDH